MKTWNSIDKSAWAKGPWQDEPDKAHWKDEVTGLNCLIVRGPHGALCGYVGVPSDHRYHGVGYDDVGHYSPKPEGYEADWYLDVHGGLTYAAGCGHSDDPAQGICHVPADGESDDIWWFGFDCAHCDDMSGMNRPESLRGFSFLDGQYRDFDYVQREVTSLARQIA